MSAPKLRFTNFKRSWDSGNLGGITIKIQDGNYGGLYPKPEEFVFEGVPFLTSKVIGTTGSFNFNKVDYITKEKNNELKKAQIISQDIIFTNRGASFGTTGIVPDYIKCGNIGPQLTLIRSNSSLVKSDYLFHYLNTAYSRNHVRKLDSGSAMNFIGLENTKKIPIKFPSLPEQEKIASFFTVIDQKLNLLKEKREKLELYKKGVMQKIFSQKLRFKDEKGNEFPEWEEKKLGDICEISKGKQLNVENMVENGLFPALNGGINYSGYTNSWNTEKETITISEGGNSCGFVSFINENFWCGGHCYALKEIKVDVKKKFLFQYLKYNELSIMRMRVGSGLPNIQKKGLNEFPIQIPHLKEQQKIANFLSALDSKINLVSTQIEKTELWKKGLLQQMFV